MLIDHWASLFQTLLQILFFSMQPVFSLPVLFFLITLGDVPWRALFWNKRRKWKKRERDLHNISRLFPAFTFCILISQCYTMHTPTHHPPPANKLFFKMCVYLLLRIRHRVCSWMTVQSIKQQYQIFPPGPCTTRLSCTLQWNIH